MVNIFLRELRANLKSLIIWSVIVGLLIMIGVAKFSAYASNPEMLAILDSMPEVVLEAMSMRAFNLTTVTGFYGIMFIYFGPCIAPKEMDGWLWWLVVVCCDAGGYPDGRKLSIIPGKNRSPARVAKKYFSVLRVPHVAFPRPAPNSVG